MCFIDSSFRLLFRPKHDSIRITKSILKIVAVYLMLNVQLVFNVRIKNKGSIE